MSSPKKITPNPLLVSTIELRYQPVSVIENLLSVIYPVFSSVLPKVVSNNIPTEIRQAPELSGPLNLFPEFSLSNGSYIVGFGNNVINFENESEYTFWDNYFPFIKEQLEKVFSLGIIQQINRIGVRYGSIFEEVNLNKILRFKPAVSMEGLIDDFVLSRTNYVQGDYSILLQLYKTAKVTKGNKDLLGAYIDLDTSLIKNIEPSNDVFRIINELHTLEKTTFFDKIITEEFLQTLKVEY